MFEYIRTHQKLMMILLLVLIVPPFALFGVQGFNGFGEGPNVLAKVEGQRITQQMFEQEFRVKLEQLRERGAAFDPALIDTPEVRARVLDEIVRRFLIQVNLEKNHVAIDKELLAKLIANDPGLQTNGQFDVQKYKQRLEAEGITGDVFDQQYYSQKIQSYRNIVALTAFAPKTITDRVRSMYTQERQIQVLSIAPAGFTDQVKLEASAIKKYYEDNPKKFVIPERADIEYVVFDLASILAQSPVKDADVANYYKQNQERFAIPEERRASHILITATPEAKPAEKAKARKQAEDVLARAKANPRDFATLAKQYSQDVGSATRGGDLGFFGRNAMLKAFEESAFALKENEISGVVESEAGFHIIQVTAIKPKFRTLAEVSGEIKETLGKTDASKKYLEAIETFKNMVEDQSDSLQPVLERFSLKLQTQNGVAPNEKSAVLNEKLLKALFSADSIKNHRNTEAVEIGPDAWIAARIVNYTPASTRSLDNAQSEIKAVLTQEEAQKLAVIAGEEKLAALRKQPSDQGFGEKTWVSRPQPRDVDWQAIKEIFKTDVRQLPAFAGINLGARGYVIYRIDALGVLQLPADKKAQLDDNVKGIGIVLAGAQQTAAYEILKARSKVKLLHPPAAATDAPQ